MKELDWAVRLVSEWDSDVAWGDDGRTRAAEVIRIIAALTIGDILDDKEIDPATRDRYLREHTTIVLEAHVAAVMTRYFGNCLPMRTIKGDKTTAGLPFVKHGIMVPRLDLNTASAEELATLPGIGPVIANRILALRAKNHGIRRLSELRRGAGLSADEIRQIAPSVFIANQRYPTRVRLQDVNAFPRTFRNFVAFLRQTDLAFGNDLPTGSTLEATVLHELDSLRDRIATSSVLSRSPVVRTSVIQEMSQLETEAASLKQNSISDIESVLIRGSAYREFVVELLKQAKKRVLLLMFFFRFKDKEAYPTDSLVSELVAANQRGVDIRVLLDRQDPHDPRPSTAVNADAYKFLSAKGIQARFDNPNQATHSKLIVIDENHVVVGSHNWTAGSLFAYDDVSVYLTSKKLTSSYVERFDGRWRASVLDE